MMMMAMLILMKLNRQWRIRIIQTMITCIELLIALQMNVSVGIGIVDDSRRWIIDEIIGMKKRLGEHCPTMIILDQRISMLNISVIG
jgi:hypothetical protein